MSTAEKKVYAKDAVALTEQLRGLEPGALDRLRVKFNTPEKIKEEALRRSRERAE